MKRFGDKLRSLRLHHNIKLVELSERLEYRTHSYLSEVEAGRKMPTVALVLKISHLFNISTDQLLKDEMEIDLTQSSYAARSL